MFRLTALLIAALFAALMLGGRNPDAPQIGLVSQRPTPVAVPAAPTNVRYTPPTTLATPTPRQQALVGTLAPAPTPAREFATLTASAVNVRSGPSTTTASLGTLLRGDTALVIARSNGWVHIRIEGDGLDGYVMEKFLKPAP